LGKNHLFDKMEIESNAIQSDQNQTQVVGYVHNFKSISKSLKENLTTLLNAKKDPNKENTKSEVSSIIEKSLAGLMEMRTNHRDLYLEIEKSRLKTQNEKEKIDAIASELEELTYLRDSIMSEINSCKNRNFPNISKLENLHSKVKTNDVQLSEGNIKENHSVLLAEFNQELSQRKKVKTEFGAKEEEKNSFIKKCEEDKNFLTKIPQNIQKIADACKPLQHLYKVGSSTNYEQIQLSKSLPTPLYNLYKKLTNLKETKVDENIEIELKENAEGADKLGFFKIQIVFSILKDKQDVTLKKYSELLDEKSFFSGAYPLKFYFSYLESHDLVLVNLQSKTVFTTDEILSKVVDDEIGTKIFNDPKNDGEKTINSKYSVYSWVQNLSREGRSTYFTEGDTPKVASLAEILKTIRKRVCNRLLLKYQVDSLRNKKQIPDNILNIFETGGIAKLDLEIITCNKISKEDYLRLIEIPSFLRGEEKPQTRLLEPKNVLEKLGELLGKRESRSSLGIYGSGAEQQAYSKETRTAFTSRAQDSTHDFFKVEFFHQKCKMTGFIIVDFDYPTSEPILVFKTIMESPKEAAIPEEIRSKFNSQALQTIKEEKSHFEKRLPPIAYDTIEKGINQNITLTDQNFVFTYKILMLMISVQKHL